MTLRGLWQTIFPPPRQPFTASHTLPLISFLVVFLVGCFILTLTETVTFSHLNPFFLVVLTPWIWWIHLAGYSGLSRPRALLALLARLTLLALFVVALAEPRAVRTQDELAVIFTVDTSASISQTSWEDAMEYVVNAAYGKPEKDEAGLVYFGSDAAVELPPSPSFPLEEPEINVQIDRDGTNIAKSLSLSAAMVTEDKQGRIILLSDGVHTEGALKGVLDDLKAKEIPVDVIKIDYDYQNEVWLERIELPPFVKTGESYEAAVILSSLRAGEGKLIVQENGHEILNEVVSFDSGKTRLNVPIYVNNPGYYEYTAYLDVTAESDSYTANNKAISHMYLKGKGRILLVSNPEGDPRDWQHLAKTLKRAERDVDVMTAYEVPRNPLALLPYDCIIFANTPADTVSEVQMQAIHDAVYNQGSGFIMIGGENSYGPGGYQGTPIEKTLPVSMDVSQKKVLPKGALAIVLHTCEFAQGNEWGKRITKQAIKVLSARDEVGVLVYGGGSEQWLFKLAPAGEYQRLAKLINNVMIGDMPSFAPTMQMGLQGLIASDATSKHMIIISDGDPTPPTTALLNQFVTAKISVSTVAINPHGGQDISKMSSIAAVTGGRYYFPKNPNKLPAIFIKEAKTIRRTAIQNKTFVPTVELASSVIKGIAGFPPLHGYVLTMPKPRSITVLRGPERGEPDPVLATWRYGVGAAAAFTSDLSPNWAANWLEWENYLAFVKQLVTEISRPLQAGNLRVYSFPASGEGVILVENYSPDTKFLEVHAQVKGPHGSSHRLELDQVGPRRYEGRFPLSGEGRYQVATFGAASNADAVAGTKSGLPVSTGLERAHGGFVVPYSQEFLRFRSNPILLEEIATKTNGRVLNGQEAPTEIYQAGRSIRYSSRPIIDWLLALMACLIPLDVALRRVQLDFGVIKGWFGAGRSTQPSDETFTSLLTRKKRVATTLKQKPAPHLMVDKKPAQTLPGQHPPTSSPSSATTRETGESKSPPQSTTERLLAAKRRALRPDDKDPS